MNTGSRPATNLGQEMVGSALARPDPSVIELFTSKAAS